RRRWRLAPGAPAAGRALGRSDDRGHGRRGRAHVRSPDVLHLARPGGGTGMTHPVQFDVVGIGNAIVDVLAHADERFLEAQGLRKGGMTLVDEHIADTLYRAMGPAVEMSGGSCANTIAAAASLGI